MINNDKTIFKYLEPQGNDILSDMNSVDLIDMLYYLDKYYLEYRPILEIDSSITFGIEIEIDNFKDGIFGHWPFQLKLNELMENNKWITKNDISLKSGIEINSEVLNDSVKTWRNIKEVCNFVANYGQIENTCASHVHVGSQFFGENLLYWYRLLKLWSIYENVIYRFSYGEYLTYRDRICRYANPVASDFDQKIPIVKDMLNSCSVYEMLWTLNTPRVTDDVLKKCGITFWRMYADEQYDKYDSFDKYHFGCTTEYRAPNGTLDEIVWQNLILFFTKLLSYCKSDKFDEDILNRRKRNVVRIFSNLDEYSKIYLDQAIELADMIFDKNIDKIYFLRQYLKYFDVADKPFVKARKFTVKN